MKCEYCNKEHNGEYGSGRFCNSKCARGYSTREKRKEINEKVSKKLIKTGKYSINNFSGKCLFCGNEIKGKVKFCDLKCSYDFIYKEYIKKWKNGIIDGTKVNGIMPSNFVRKYLFEKYNNRCCKCGWNEVNKKSNKIPLQINHIDGNSSNNKEENLELLCPNCHSLTSTYGSLNRGNADIKRLEYFKYKK